MNKMKPKCSSKCSSCLFYFTNGCIAPPGDDYYIEISEKQAKLILNNQDRFELTSKTSKELINKFPELVVV